MSTGCKIGIETEADGTTYKIASGEPIPDHGGLCRKGTTGYGHGVTFRRRNADVH